MTRSLTAVQALSQVDPQFAELVDVLFGKAVDPRDVWEFVYTPDGVAKMLASDVSKAGPDQSDLHLPSGRLIPVLKARRKSAGAAKVRKAARPDESMDVVWAGEFAKMDTDKRQVFGWASIVSIDGEPVVDKQGDWMDPEDIEKAAYKYVVESRKGGHQHKRELDGAPFHASDMIESFVITPEKIEKMHLPPETPCGWWVGYKVNDEEAWQKVKKGEVTGFSIHGRGKRRPMEANV
jgi:hypothetical protein